MIESIVSSEYPRTWGLESQLQLQDMCLVRNWPTKDLWKHLAQGERTTTASLKIASPKYVHTRQKKFCSHWTGQMQSVHTRQKKHKVCSHWTGEIQSLFTFDRRNTKSVHTRHKKQKFCSHCPDRSLSTLDRRNTCEGLCQEFCLLGPVSLGFSVVNSSDITGTRSASVLDTENTSYDDEQNILVSSCALSGGGDTCSEITKQTLHSSDKSRFSAGLSRRNFTVSLIVPPCRALGVITHDAICIYTPIREKLSHRGDWLMETYSMLRGN